MKLELAQYRELAAFSQFASDLDKNTRDQLERGNRLTELLKQKQYEPVPLGIQVCVIYAGTHGFVDKVPVARVPEWETGFTRFLRSERKDLLEEIEKQKALDDDLNGKIDDAIKAFNRQFGVESPAEDKKGEPAKAEAKTEGTKREETKPEPPKAEAKPEEAKPEPQKAEAKPEETKPEPPKTEAKPEETGSEQERRGNSDRRQAERRKETAANDPERRQDQRRKQQRRTKRAE